MSEGETIHIPENIAKELEAFAERHKISTERAFNIYQEKFKWVAGKLRGQSPDVIHAYALKITKVFLGRTSALKEYQVIVLGWPGERVTKAGRRVVPIYALLKDVETGAEEKTQILFFDEFADKVEELMPLNFYVMTLAKAGALYMTTSDSQISEPQPLGIDPDSLYTKLGFKKFVLSDILNNVSRTREDGFVDDWDLKFCDVVVVSSRLFENKKTGAVRGVLTVSDDSVYETQVTEDGKVIPNLITVWCAKEFARFSEGSLVKVLGTVTLPSEDEPQINAISILPIDNLFEVQEVRVG